MAWGADPDNFIAPDQKTYGYRFSVPEEERRLGISALQQFRLRYSVTSGNWFSTVMQPEGLKNMVSDVVYLCERFKWKPAKSTFFLKEIILNLITADILCIPLMWCLLSLYIYHFNISLIEPDYTMNL